MRLIGLIMIIAGFVIFFNGPHSQVDSLNAIVTTLIGSLSLMRADVNDLQNTIEKLEDLRK